MQDDRRRNRREGDGRLEQLEREVEELGRRCKAPLELYEGLVPWGIDRVLPILLQWFIREQAGEVAGVNRGSLWDRRWIRWAAVAAVLFGALQVLEALALVYVAAHVKGP